MADHSPYAFRFTVDIDAIDGYATGAGPQVPVQHVQQCAFAAAAAAHDPYELA